ncbi:MULTISPECIES: DUF6985 domain-containing protein [Bacillus]|jgi:hypothetical protein|uniref:DUF6985 domain-containing protein n=3 Tax=Bacillus pseudomycoides TaxID=64104 RepID=A0AAJ1Z098_9BACI|nr:hypothetical protein [Bacillus pseudomycoides]EEM10710.1 hypothetical protein bmyco0003_26010 [Bacillus pseudomycoides]KFN13388.1 hypothetical protein DJ94_4654 [Bacillus pseudomycoides]MCR8857902.1 hypothetical protein [Bacillus pseudomycoides]MDR4189764.1 hypothetical protein [Bacillus pseudomycoides]MDR4326179.1 hypothetical protein [Bacillus pseudomycoides]
MKKINHKLFGELIYDGYWTGKQKIAILGHDKIVPLTIDGEEHDVFSAIQEEAYSKFIADTNRLIQEAEQAIFEYYQEECLEYRAMLGDESADEIVPIITTTQQLGKLVDPIGLTILPDFEDGVRRLGLIFNCTWEEDGIGVRFENEEVIEVGYQDIVI